MSHPQAAYAALTHGLMGRWSYTLRTIPDISDLLQPLEDVIRKRLLLALTGKPAFTDIERALLALPTRFRGLNIPVIREKGSTEFSASCKITPAIVDSIVQKAYAYDHNVLGAVLQTKAEVNKEKRNAQEENAEYLCQQLSPSLKRAIDLNRETGSSSWLAALPIEEYGFSLHKSAFQDTLCLRYGWKPKFLPTIYL